MPIFAVDMATHLNIGDQAPEFELKDAEGWLHDLKGLQDGQWLVLYFYPKDETPGCTMQACAFRDQYEDFVEAGAKVVGISRDSVESHQQFIANRRLPFMLLSDMDMKAHQAYGVNASLFGIWRDRITFVIDPEGKIRFMFNSTIDMKSHVSKSLAFIQANRQA